eukprot:COSAG05_NODE_5818_length_1080_cov_2.815946_2_plen_54_part_00
MQDKGESDAEMVDLSATVSFNIVTDAEKNVTVDQVVPVITLGALNVKVIPPTY